MENKNTPIESSAFATEPTKFVRFWRVEPFRQIFMFFKLNLKIMLMVVKGHS